MREVGSSARIGELEPITLAFVEAVLARIPHGANFQDLTGVSARTLANWKKKLTESKQASAKLGALALICSNLFHSECDPQELKLPLQTCGRIRTHLQHSAKTLQISRLASDASNSIDVLASSFEGGLARVIREYRDEHGIPTLQYARDSIIEWASEVQKTSSRHYLLDSSNTHALRVLGFANEIVRPFIAGGRLTPNEAFILVAAIYVHDLGHFLLRDAPSSQTNAWPALSTARAAKFHAQAAADVLAEFEHGRFPAAIEASLQRMELDAHPMKKYARREARNVREVLATHAPYIRLLVEYHNAHNKRNQVELSVDRVLSRTSSSASPYVKASMLKVLVGVIQVADALDMTAERIANERSLRSLLARAEDSFPSLTADEIDAILRALVCYYHESARVVYDDSTRSLRLTVNQNMPEEMITNQSPLQDYCHQKLLARVSKEFNDCIELIEHHSNIAMLAPEFVETPGHRVSVSSNAAQRLLAQHRRAATVAIPKRTLASVFKRILDRCYGYLTWVKLFHPQPGLLYQGMVRSHAQRRAGNSAIDGIVDTVERMIFCPREWDVSALADVVAVDDCLKLFERLTTDWPRDRLIRNKNYFKATFGVFSEVYIPIHADGRLVACVNTHYPGPMHASDLLRIGKSLELEFCHLGVEILDIQKEQLRDAKRILEELSNRFNADYSSLLDVVEKALLGRSYGEAVDLGDVVREACQSTSAHSEEIWEITQQDLRPRNRYSTRSAGPSSEPSASPNDPVRAYVASRQALAEVLRLAHSRLHPFGRFQIRYGNISGMPLVHLTLSTVSGKRSPVYGSNVVPNFFGSETLRIAACLKDSEILPVAVDPYERPFGHVFAPAILATLSCGHFRVISELEGSQGETAIRLELPSAELFT